ncbi:MAG: hypothetical protein KC431_02700, partial [Myxococcales bacterium]|nr:hypothetical protein [Myxococcales bacterium]
MPMLMIAQPGMAAAVVLAQGLRGAGDTRSPVISAAVGGVLVRLTAVWLLAFELELGLRGVWLSTACDWTVRTLILGWIFMRGRWRSLEL